MLVSYKRILICCHISRFGCKGKTPWRTLCSLYENSQLWSVAVAKLNKIFESPKEKEKKYPPTGKYAVEGSYKKTVENRNETQKRNR